jgi:steroid delta-isomerase-like uncharacterized protein
MVRSDAIALVDRPLNRRCVVALSDKERIEAQRETVRQHIAGENDHDWQRVWDTFIQDERAYYDVGPLAAKYEGFSGVQDFYSIIEAAVPDFHVTVTGDYDCPGTSIREVTVTGTHKGEYCGVPASSRLVSIEIAAFYLFGEGKEAGKLVAERIYFDNEILLRQMRGEADAPTGLGLATRSAS